MFGLSFDCQPTIRIHVALHRAPRLHFIGEPLTSRPAKHLPPCFTCEHKWRQYHSLRRLFQRREASNLWPANWWYEDAATASGVLALTWAIGTRRVCRRACRHGASTINRGSYEEQCMNSGSPASAMLNPISVRIDHRQSIYHFFASIPSGGSVSTGPLPTSAQFVLNAVPLLSVYDFIIARCVSGSAPLNSFLKKWFASSPPS